jgi:hypothetical protein
MAALICRYLYVPMAARKRPTTSNINHIRLAMERCLLGDSRRAIRHGHAQWEWQQRIAAGSDPGLSPFQGTAVETFDAIDALNPAREMASG